MLYGQQIVSGQQIIYDQYSGEKLWNLTSLNQQIQSLIKSQKYANDLFFVACAIPVYYSRFDYNDQSMQSASLMKLYVMGAVYDNYQRMINTYGKSVIDYNLKIMITISDNNAWKNLVSCLGNGSYSAGCGVVTNWSHLHGYNESKTIPVEYGNYTSVKDCVSFYQDIYNNEFSHSADMLNLLKQHQKTWKIPAGLPAGRVSGNKTGELSNTENDTAIIYGKSCTYLLSVMSTNLSNTYNARQIIQKISKLVYNFIN